MAGAKWRIALLIGITPLASVNAASDQPGISGIYLCKSLERAAITSNHFDRVSPKAHVDERGPIGFRMQITSTESDKYRIIGLPYDGPDRELQEGAGVLQSAYIGDGSVFRALEGPGFLTLKGGEGHYEFYQAGLESPGGEDTQVAVRWGRCNRSN
jgi:hypothetical protein